MISKPVYGCPICMTPWWGTIIYWMFFGTSGVDWLLTIGCAAGMGVLSVVFIDIKDAAVEITKRLEGKPNRSDSDKEGSDKKDNKTGKGDKGPEIPPSDIEIVRRNLGQNLGRFENDEAPRDGVWSRGMSRDAWDDSKTR